MYVDLQGIQDGAYCGICDLLNKTYYLGPVGGTADYCIWYNDYGAGIHYSLQVEIGHAGGGRYEINVWLYVSDLYCPDYKDNNLYWHHEQYAPYDCDNLDLLIPFQWDEGGEGGCTGGTCRIRTYPESS